MSGPVDRAEHYRRLNDYRGTAEYAAFYRSIGADRGDPAGLPSMLGNRWEITAELYDEFLNMLPPMGWSGGTFYMSEFTIDDITAKFSKEGGRYFCEHARFPNRRGA